MFKLNYLLLLTFLILGCTSSRPQYGYVDTVGNRQPPSKTSANNAHTRQTISKPNYPKYIIQKGDTLSSISRRSGLAVERIIHFNRLKSTHLEIGQTLYLPGVYKLTQDKAQTKVPISYPVSRNVSIVSRARWAKDKIKGNITPMGKINKITVHHTDDGPKLSKMSDVKFIQGIENHHRNNRKWACIGYHYIIGRDGTIYEGRPIKYQGAHARSNNPNNAGISLIGDFNKSYPSKGQLSALTALLANLRSKYKISNQHVYGHKNLCQTECPGKYLASWLLRYKAAR
jgi:LysM repeat protein